MAIFKIAERFDQLRELADRKIFILQAIEAQNALTTELREKIENTFSPADLEDLYLPYKPKRRTRAQVARENGLEPLAKIIMARNCADPAAAATRYLGKNVATTDDALAGAADIIAEWVSEDRRCRQQVRNSFQRFARITSKVVKTKEEEAQNYKSYFNVDEPLQRCSSHRYLAMRRGAAEGVLRVAVGIDDDRAIERLRQNFAKKGGSPACNAIVDNAVADAYRRLIRPSITNETEAEAKLHADQSAIATLRV